MSETNASDQDQTDKPLVVQHLDLAIETAEEQGMSTSELLGLFYYYAHNIAASAREGASTD